MTDSPLADQPLRNSQWRRRGRNVNQMKREQLERDRARRREHRDELNAKRLEAYRVKRLLDGHSYRQRKPRPVEGEGSRYASSTRAAPHAIGHSTGRRGHQARPSREATMSAAPVLVAAASATIIRPSIDAWRSHAARLEMEAAERRQDRLARAIAYLERRLARRSQAKVEQFAFEF
jgi:hypothetical protein